MDKKVRRRGKETMTKYFNITINGDHLLKIEDIWPDGDAPENPTAEDVRRLIESLVNADEVVMNLAAYLIDEWNLQCDVGIQLKETNDLVAYFRARTQKAETRVKELEALIKNITEKEES